MSLPRVRFAVRRAMISAAVVAAVTLVGTALVERNRRWARVAARRQEAGVRKLIQDEPLANLGLRVPRDGITGMLSRFGVQGPHDRRGERALMAINPVRPAKGLTRPAGPTIDACRAVPDGVPAELTLLRPVPVSDPRAVLGPYSSRSRGEIGRVRGIEFYTYGGLDVGIKDGALIAVRVRSLGRPAVSRTSGTAE